MSRVLEFPQASARRHVGAALLANPDPHTHAVQFYEKDEFLVDTVAQFLAPGLEAGDRLLVIATPEHVGGFAKSLGAAMFDAAVASGQLTVLDARETLAKFMVGEMPDRDLFQHVLGRAVATMLEGQPGTRRIRAYGEMVDLLWRGGDSRAAIRLEELWNEAGKVHSFSLLCAYVMGSFYKEGDSARFMEICRNHSHVLPTESFSSIHDADARLREISLLQQRARTLENEVAHRKQLEAALRDALGERARVEDELRASVQREREARERAEASDAFKEIFFGVLGHDLRNPLNTILTTARLMQMRDELPADSHKRLQRVISSGVRMQRMIEQILDVTRARHADGISIDRDHHDLAAIVVAIVEETRAANPGHPIEVSIEDACVAPVDRDRFEQVVSNLLGNAIVHGEPGAPIAVALRASDASASLLVHNHGPPIDPEFMPRLFDPFRQGPKPLGRSDGLGLGLYISERIVTAHGGTLQVSSARETGTLFAVMLPRS